MQSLLVNRLRTRVGHVLPFKKRREQIALSRYAISSRIKRSSFRVVFAALTPGGFSGPGKVQPKAFFPQFCTSIQNSGGSIAFVNTVKGLRSSTKSDIPSIVVFIYREVAYQIDASALEQAVRRKSLIFNSPTSGEIVASKGQTNAYLAARGVPMPSMNPRAGVQIFSNAIRDTGAEVQLLDDMRETDANRYNTEFIDTRVDFRGESYFTTVRLMCVGPEIVHAYVRVRPTKEGNPSVHAKDTPMHPELIEYLQERQVRQRYDELARLAECLSDTLGYGFYAHDLLIASNSSDIFVAESGFKFNDWSYTDRLDSIKEYLPSHKILFPTSRFASASADAFLRVCHRALKEERGGTR